MNGQTHDEQGKGHGSTFAWRQPVKPEQLAGGRHGLGAAQGNGVGMAFCKSDWHQHHQLSAPHYHVSSKGYSPGAPNHWAMVWDHVGTQAGAAAAAAAAAARGRLGQWARLRREARGGGILLPQEVEALGRQYSCLEHEFQGFKQKWPELDKEAANRRARRRAHSVQPPSASSHLAHAQGTTGGRTPSRSQRDPSRPRTAPSTTQTHAASRSASTSRAHSNVRPGARTPERPPLSNPMLRSSGNSSKLPARGTARTPERRTHSPLPSPSAARLQQQRNPSRDRTMPNAQHNAHLLPVAQQQQQQQQQHSSRLPLSSPRTARTPERSQPPPFSTHIALNHAQPPTAHRPITPSSQHRTPEHSRPLFQTSKLREDAGTGHEALALLTPLPSQRHELPQQQQQQQRQQLLRHEQGNTPRRRPGDAADTTAATPARLPHTEAAKADVKQQQRREATSSATAAGACTPPNAFTWQLEGGTPAYSPFGHPLQVGDIGDDDEDPFSMPPSFIGGRVSAAPDGRNSDSSAMQDTLLPHGPASSSSAGTPGQRPMRQSSELLLPSLGSLSAMLAATSHPNTPRDNIQQQHHHQPKTHGIPMQLPPQQQQQQQQQQLQLLQQQPHSQHARLMQRRLVQEQRRREMLLEQQHGHAPTSHTSAPTNTTTTATTHPAAAPHTLTLRAPSAPHAPHASTFHLHHHSPTSPPTASALPDGSARAASEPTYLTSPHQGGQANHYGSSSNSNSNRAAADPTTPSPKLPGSASGSCSKAGKEERPSGGSGRARVLAIAAALSEAGSPAARRAHSSPPHLPSPSSSPQLAPARRGAGNSPAAAAAGARGASNLHHLEGALEGRRKTAPAATTAGAAAAAAGAVEGSRRARQAGKAGGWAPAKSSSSSSSGSSTGGTGRTSHAPPSSKTRTNATTPRTAKSSAQAPAPSSISRRSPAALPSSRIAVPRTPTAPPSTFSAAAAAATAIPSSATTPTSDSRKPTSSRSGTNSTTRQQRQHTPVHTKTSVGHLTNQHPPSHLTRPLHPSIHSDPAAAALAAAAASLSTARRRSGLSSKTTSAVGSPDSAAGSSAYNSPRPSISGDPPASRPRTRVQRGGDTSSGPTTPAAHDTSPRQKHQPLGSPFFVTPASRTTSTLGRDDDDATSRRDSGGGSGNGNAALPKRSSSTRMRKAVAASPTDPPAFLASPLSCSPSTHTARYSDASATTTPEFTTTTTTPGSRVQQHKARRLTAPVMRSLPPNIPHGVRGSDGNAGIRKWGCYTDGPSSSQLALHDPTEEDLLPLMQLSTVRSMRQSRMSAASSARSSMAAGGGGTSQTTPSTFASPPSHSPLRKSRASDSIALQQRHPNLQHPRHASVTFLLPPTPTSGGGPAPSSSQDKPLTSSTSPNPTQRPAFRLSNSSPLSYTTGARQRSQLSSPSPSISTSLAGSPPRGGSGPGGSGRLGGVVRGSRSGGGMRPSPPPACTPHPFTALQSKSFTGGGAARQATAAAAAEIHSHPPHTASQPQLQPTSRTLFDSSSCAVLDEDADVELVSRGGSSSSHQSGKGNPLARGSSRDGLTRNTRGPEARPPARQSSGGSHAHPPQQQHSVGVCAPATTTNPPNNATSSTATAAKGLGGGLASYWSRLFSRAPTQHPSPPQPHPANMVGETA